ncbi:Hypothetical protein AT6N2_L0194 [Agrobacterium tumefaciens]|nr:Hypothetical protein AT6N2_L0194 [Agrobacterium tumefaciens]
MLLSRRCTLGSDDGLGGPRFRLYLGAGSRLLEAFGNNPVSVLQAVGDNPAVADGASDAHPALFDSVFGIDNQHARLPAGVTLHGLLRHGESRLLNALLDLNANIHARQQIAVRVGEFATQRYLTGRFVHSRFREQQATGNRVTAAVIEQQINFRLIGPCHQLAVLKRLAQANEVGGRLGKVGIDWIELLDRRQTFRTGSAHKRTFGDARATDHAADRRFHIGILKVEPRFRDTGFSHCDLRIGLGKQRDGVVELLLRTDIGTAQLLLPVGRLTRLKLGCLCPAQCSLSAVNAHLEWRGIDPVENVAFLHERALFKHALDDDARHPRTNFGKPCRGDAAGQLVRDRQLFRLYRHDLDRSRRRSAGCSSLLVATSDKNDARQEHRYHLPQSFRHTALRIHKIRPIYIHTKTYVKPRQHICCVAKRVSRACEA